MREPWRPLALATALTVTVGACVATAQTVVVRNAPRGSKVEVVVNEATAGCATVDRLGDATVGITRR